MIGSQRLPGRKLGRTVGYAEFLEALRPLPSDRAVGRT
jgi:hypothetical protein